MRINRPARRALDRSPDPLRMLRPAYPPAGLPCPRAPRPVRQSRLSLPSLRSDPIALDRLLIQLDPEPRPLRDGDISLLELQRLADTVVDAQGLAADVAGEGHRLA